MSIADNFVDKKVYVKGEQFSISSKYHMVKRKLVDVIFDDESTPMRPSKIGSGGSKDKDKAEK